MSKPVPSTPQAASAFERASEAWDATCYTICYTICYKDLGYILVFEHSSARRPRPPSSARARRDQWFGPQAFIHQVVGFDSLNGTATFPCGLICDTWKRGLINGCEIVTDTRIAVTLVDLVIK